MHVPDGFLDLPTSAATGALAAGAVGLALQRADREVRQAGAPLAGLTAAFVFAVQMVNFPVGAGTSGHLMGGALAAALVGPWTAVLCMTVVLVVQALMFADGGLTALGTNITLMGVVTVLVGYGVTTAVLRVLPRRTGSVVPAAVTGAFVSVPAAAVVFVGLYVVGGTVEIPLASLLTAMVGWHTVIGVGEAVITGVVLAAVMATRPDLVHAARRMRPDLVLTDAAGTRALVPADPVTTDGGPARRPLGVALAVSLLVAGTLSLVASASPDGLAAVSERLGFAATARDSATAAGPFAGYGLRGVGNPWLAGALAGVVGVLVTVLAGLALARLARRRERRGADPAQDLDRRDRDPARPAGRR